MIEDVTLQSVELQTGKILLHIKEMNLGSDAQFGFRFEAPVCLSPF